MKRHFDFIINEDKGRSKTILRFYPKQSSVHGFEDIPPKTWDEVYKTYMTFSVLKYYSIDESGTYGIPYKLFSYVGDEGEGLRVLRGTLKEMISEDLKERYEVIPVGDGVDWEIYTREINNDIICAFTMIDNLTGEAYRFYIQQRRLEEFYKALDDFLEYMLFHSEGI